MRSKHFTSVEKGAEFVNVLSIWIGCLLLCALCLCRGMVKFLRSSVLISIQLVKLFLLAEFLTKSGGALDLSGTKSDGAFDLH